MLDNFEQELHEYNLQHDEWKKKHLGKFNNLDLFFQKVEKEILYYFEEKKEFNNLNDFEIFLKNGIKKYLTYMNYKGDNRNEFKKLKKDLGDFDETYDKIIYFGEFNPVEARRQRLKEKGELNVDVEKEKGYFINILSKILEDIKKESEN